MPMKNSRGKTNLVVERSPYEPRTPGPADSRLDAFVGRWNLEGRAHDGPFGPTATVTAVETYDWLPGGLYLIHRFTGRLGDKPMACIEIIDYDEASESYLTRSFYGDGTSNVWRSREHDGTWTLAGEWQAGGEVLLVRCTAVFGDGGRTLTGKWEYSDNGSGWHPFWETKATKA
jgi:hypothetical protein